MLNMLLSVYCCGQIILQMYVSKPQASCSWRPGFFLCAAAAAALCRSMYAPYYSCCCCSLALYAVYMYIYALAVIVELQKWLTYFVVHTMSTTGIRGRYRSEL